MSFLRYLEMSGQISASSGLVGRLTCTSLGASLGGITMKLTRNLLTTPVSEQSVRLRGVSLTYPNNT